MIKKDSSEFPIQLKLFEEWFFNNMEYLGLYIDSVGYLEKCKDPHRTYISSIAERSFKTWLGSAERNS